MRDGKKMRNSWILMVICLLFETSMHHVNLFLEIYFAVWMLLSSMGIVNIKPLAWSMSCQSLCPNVWMYQKRNMVYDL